MTPVVLLRLRDDVRRPQGFDVFTALPYARDNQHWVRHVNLPERVVRRSATWVPVDKSWATHRSTFRSMIAACIERYGEVWVHQEHRLSHKFQCDMRCVNAKGDECVCSCGGVNHKGSAAGYLLIGDTVLQQVSSEVTLTKRLLRRLEMSTV